MLANGRSARQRDTEAEASMCGITGIMARRNSLDRSGRSREGRPGSASLDLTTKVAAGGPGWTPAALDHRLLRSWIQPIAYADGRYFIYSSEIYNGKIYNNVGLPWELEALGL
jgi:hypothetical protein